MCGGWVPCRDRHTYPLCGQGYDGGNFGGSLWSCGHERRGPGVAGLLLLKMDRLLGWCERGVRSLPAPCHLVDPDGVKSRVTGRCS